MRKMAVKTVIHPEEKVLVEALVRIIVITTIVLGGIAVVIPRMTMEKMVRMKRGNTVGSIAMRIVIVIIALVGNIVIGTTPLIIVIVRKTETRMRMAKEWTRKRAAAVGITKVVENVGIVMKIKRPKKGKNTQTAHLTKDERRSRKKISAMLP